LKNFWLYADNKKSAIAQVVLSTQLQGRRIPENPDYEPLFPRYPLIFSDAISPRIDGTQVAEMGNHENSISPTDFDRFADRARRDCGAADGAGSEPDGHVHIPD
jgi:hypothetical protein